MKVETLRRELNAKIVAGQKIAEDNHRTAEAENRLLTQAETDAIDTAFKDAQAIAGRIARAEADDFMIAELQRIAGVQQSTTDRSGQVAAHLVRRSMGSQWTDSDAYRAAFGKGVKRSSTWGTEAVEVFDPRAATLTEDPASGGALVTPQYVPGILPLATRRLVVADLLSSGTTDSNMISYFKEKTWTNAAAPILEGTAKPESALTFEAANAPVRKIAHWLPVSEEMLEDVAAIRSYIDARLALGVSFAEETQLLNGTGVAPELLGLRVAATAADVVRNAAEPNFEAILRQIMAIYGASLLMPDGVVLNPADWTTTLLAKTGQGQYFTQGPFAPIQSPTLWGLPVAITPAMAATVALVGAFKMGAQVFRRGGLRIEASNSHQDFFVKNLVAIRAEERLALAIYRPGAFGEVTGLGAVA